MAPSPAVVASFVKNCNSELLYIRKLSISALTSILDLQKRGRKKVKVDIEKVSGVGKIDHANLAPGDRPDNQWLEYDPAKFISSAEEWERTVFIEKTHWGYYCWPTTLYTAAPASEQPPVNRKREELPEAERVVHDSFR